MDKWWADCPRCDRACRNDDPRNVVEVEKAKQANERGHLSLGELVAILSFGPDLPVRSTHGGGVGSVDSYRGYYSDIAIEPGGDLTSHELAGLLSDAVGSTFTGYKGGEYTMGRMTPVWVSGYGDASGLAVTGVRVEADAVHLELTAEVW